MKKIKKKLVVVGLACSPFYYVSADAVNLGEKTSFDHRFVTQVTKVYLAKQNVQVNKVKSYGSTVEIRMALESKDIDVYWENTATAFAVFYDQEISSYSELKTADEKQGISWLAPSVQNDSFAIAVRDDAIETKNIFTISDLLKDCEQSEVPIILASTPSFSGRADGSVGIQKHYGKRLDPKNVWVVGPNRSYRFLRRKDVDAAVVISSDIRNREFGFRLLEDDKQFFKDYLLTPVVRTEVKTEALETALNELSSFVGSETYQEAYLTYYYGEVELEIAAENYVMSLLQPTASK